MKNMRPQDALEKAVEKLGSQTNIAKLVNVKPPTVSAWLSGKRPIPAKRAIQIEKLTGVSRKDLCPQVFDGE